MKSYSFPQKVGTVVILFLPKCQQSVFIKELKSFKSLKGEAPLDLHCTDTRHDFFKILEQLILKIENEQYYFYLHIITHGCEDGMGVSIEEMLKWNTFFYYTRKINILFNGGLLILLSICTGNAMIKDIDPSLRAPFKCIIGSFEELTFPDAIAGFKEFYALPFPNPIFIRNCVDRMNIAVGRTKKHLFHSITDEFCFDKICDPDRDPIFYQNMVYQFVQRLTIAGKRHNRSFVEFCEDVDQNIRTLLRYTCKLGRNYFLFKDQINLRG